MSLIIKKKVALLGMLMLFGASFQAAAVPFFAKQNRSPLAQTKADAGTQDAMVTGYTQDVQSGVGDFQFLARNFSGSNSGTTTNNTSSGLIGSAPISVTGLPVVPAPIPGSLALVALGLPVMWWRRRK
jgi:hypothetical protein